MKPLPWILSICLFAGPSLAAEPSAPNTADAAGIPLDLGPSVRHPGTKGGLTLQEDAMAVAAWKYFENNFQPATCLYNSVDQYPSTTMWDTASAIAGLVSAFELDLIHDPKAFDDRMHCLLDSLARLPLYQEILPNKAYNTISLEKVDYNNNPGELGVSAIDIGRLMMWLAIVKERYPMHATEVDRVVLRWKFCDIVDRGGTLYGAQTINGKPRFLQEGRLGYEEYAANGFQIWGFDTPNASSLEPYEELGIHGVPIAYDGRDPKEFGAHTYVVTEAYLLGGLELNWDDVTDNQTSDRWHSDHAAARLARRVYKVQERHYHATGKLTARTEHQIDGPPYFVYDTIYSDGQPWATISDDGKSWPDLAAVSSKAAVGMAALFPTSYTEKLLASIVPLVDPEKGVYEGYYEKDNKRIESLTANTNGIILETLLYKTSGKIYRPSGRKTLWDSTPNDEYPGVTQCLPRRSMLP